MKHSMLILLAVLSASCAHGPLLDSSDFSIAPEGTLWSYSSKQKILWSIPDLTPHQYTLVLYLESDSIEGCISSQTVVDGTGVVNYVANSVVTGSGEHISLSNGEYSLYAYLYRRDESCMDGAFCSSFRDKKPLAEKRLGVITIIDSDVKELEN